MLTAHDFPSAHAADAAGIDVVLVGDSLGMVAMGLENTTEMVMEEMILHCRSVARGAKNAFIVSCPCDWGSHVQSVNVRLGGGSAYGVI